jgi:Na+/H+ antiporter
VHELEVVLGLMVVVAGLATLARRLSISYPILLVLGGLVLGFVPGLPHVELAPEVAFLIFLPPLLYVAGFFTSLRDFKANLRSIGLLAIGLPLFTTAVVAWVANRVVGLDWPAACLLGAIVSPPDAVAASAVAQRLRLPRRIVTLLEGESLLNDATALVAYRMALAAVATGTFSLLGAAGEFAVNALGGVAIGLAVGWLAVAVRRRIDDTPVEVTIALLTPFAAYLPAEMLHVSGVLAVVTTGLYVGWHSPRIMTAQGRLQGRPVWTMLVFLLNGLVFVLIGLQLNGIMAALAERPLGLLIGQGLAISLAMIVARLVWVFPGAYLSRWPGPGGRRGDPRLPGRWVFVVAWAGMRGVVSLAAALALPTTLPDGRPFEERELIVFLTYCAILVTLVGQGLTLPPLIRALGIRPDDSVEREETSARLAAARAALAELDERAAADGAVSPRLRAGLREYYEAQLHLVEARDDPQHYRDHDHEADHERDEQAYRALRQSAIDAQRRTILGMRQSGAIGDEVMHRLVQELDLEEARLG